VRFLAQGCLTLNRFAGLASLNESQPKPTFFRFLAANSETHHPVFVAQGLVGLDAICRHRARRPHQLFYILDIRDRSQKPLDKKSHLLREQRRPLLEIPWFLNHRISLCLELIALSLAFGVLVFVI
jgi:hypothetical protein